MRRLLASIPEMLSRRVGPLVASFITHSLSSYADVGTGDPGQAQNIYNSVEGEAWKRSSKPGSRASLVAQWLRIRLPMQGTRVRALAREDPTCRGATKPVRHNY